jgi:hypothetical protein
MISIPKGQKKAKKPTLAALKAKMDKVWSEWVRRKDARGGLATCVTCSAVAPWKNMQCGHFVSRVHLATRFLEQNTAVQCYSCNVLRSGNYVEYAVWMEANWGWQTIRDLRDLKHTTVKYSRSDYETMIEETKAKLQALDSDERLAA